MVIEYLEHCLTGPNLPATVLLIIVLIYGIFVILGMFDFNLFDFDIDIDTDGDAFTNAGLWSLKKLNLGQVPIMIWLGVLGLSWWAVSMLLWFSWDRETYEPRTWLIAQLIVRNVIIALAITKLLTQPLIQLFEKGEDYQPETLIGKECIVSTYEATMEFGQARYQTDGAPLLLNVRMEEGTLAKGDRAIIVNYDPNKRVYRIAPAKHEVQK
ncbi:MAG: DUF1449 family protein [Pirellulaceae bacterium]|nr:DUF1449 family protein [Planctomycetales bacterium]MCA9162365.1 DUF1449 family protein [Planctomycetales bacterium]MCA9202901.1 DUF1449 family protein [Planctomycetales bacterium]MCA9209029.1 DUF1449 family protein [Planctomycetales bacterium]MCA9219770.1 DUF1449 family protein [Planctomycetales bacterium]